MKGCVVDVQIAFTNRITHEEWVVHGTVRIPNSGLMANAVADVTYAEGGAGRVTGEVFKQGLTKTQLIDLNFDLIEVAEDKGEAAREAAADAEDVDAYDDDAGEDD